MTMHRPALAAVLLLLAACGDGGGTTSQPAASPAQAPAPATDAEKAAILASLPAPWSAGDIENGRRVFARCRACHTLTEGGPNMTGPNLHGVFGRVAGSKDGFNYSPALREAGFAWDAERLDHWLENPREFLRGNKMSFAGIRDAEDRRDLIAFLKVETGYAPPAV
ncbi:MAG: cytochrome c family protein [Brevundimonas sp.]|uniref:c-type cytochrome n=1 Tax=Brevundimonas sp. TaxID=1871086 RepID=UPI0017B5B736|nr:cytochrome c family protein [Brevundimonas sp.]MBA4805514.1 cytochrome c family protein [Brevundimonas sp.]